MYIKIKIYGMFIRFDIGLSMLPNFTTTTTLPYKWYQTSPINTAPKQGTKKFPFVIPDKGYVESYDVELVFP